MEQSKPRFIIHVCDRDHLYMVCQLVADDTDPVYKTIAECPTMRWSRVFIDAAREHISGLDDDLEAAPTPQ